MIVSTFNRYLVIISVANGILIIVFGLVLYTTAFLTSEGEGSTTLQGMQPEDNNPDTK